MLGSMAAIPLADDPDPAAMDGSAAPTPAYRLQTQLLEEYSIEVPVYYWPAAPRRLLRISAQAYNTPEQYRQLAAALPGLL